MNQPILSVCFFRTEAGSEPVREWLKKLSAQDRKTIGEDIKTVQRPGGRSVCRWCVRWARIAGSPHSSGRSDCQNPFHRRRRRDGALHGFIKKSQDTPLNDLKLAEGRRDKVRRNHEQETHRQ